MIELLQSDKLIGKTQGTVRSRLLIYIFMDKVPRQHSFYTPLYPLSRNIRGYPRFIVRLNHNYCTLTVGNGQFHTYTHTHVHGRTCE